MSPRAPPTMTSLGLALVREARTKESIIATPAQVAPGGSGRRTQQRARSACKEAAHLNCPAFSSSPRSHTHWHLVRRSHDNSIGTSPRSHTPRQRVRVQGRMTTRSGYFTDIHRHHRQSSNGSPQTHSRKRRCGKTAQQEIHATSGHVAIQAGKSTGRQRSAMTCR